MLFTVVLLKMFCIKQKKHATNLANANILPIFAVVNKVEYFCNALSYVGLYEYRTKLSNPQNHSSMKTKLIASMISLLLLIGTAKAKTHDNIQEVFDFNRNQIQQITNH